MKSDLKLVAKASSRAIATRPWLGEPDRVVIRSRITGAVLLIERSGSTGVLCASLGLSPRDRPPLHWGEARPFAITTDQPVPAAGGAGPHTQWLCLRGDSLPGDCRPYRAPAVGKYWSMTAALETLQRLDVAVASSAPLYLRAWRGTRRWRRWLEIVKDWLFPPRPKVVLARR